MLTIIIGLIDIFSVVFLANLLMVILLMCAFLYLVRFSKDRGEKFQYARLLMGAVFFEIVFLFLFLFFPNATTYGIATQEEMLIIASIKVAKQLFFAVPYAIVFGLIFAYIGKKDEELGGNYLFYAGIIEFVSSCVVTVLEIIYQYAWYAWYTSAAPLESVIIFYTLSNLVWFILFWAFLACLALHAITLHDKNFNRFVIFLLASFFSPYLIGLLII